MARTKSINFPNDLTEMSALFDKLQRAVTNRVLTAASLGIKGASASAVTANASTVVFLIDGVLCTKAASDMSALAGTVTAAKFNVFAFTVNAAGTLHTYMGTQAATLAGVVLPTIPDGEVSLGFVIINPTGTGNFVGGTTQLDDATVTPGAVFVNTGDVFNASLSTL